MPHFRAIFCANSAIQKGSAVTWSRKRGGATLKDRYVYSYAADRAGRGCVGKCLEDARGAVRSLTNI